MRTMNDIASDCNRLIAEISREFDNPAIHEYMDRLDESEDADVSFMTRALYAWIDIHGQLVLARDWRGAEGVMASMKRTASIVHRLTGDADILVSLINQVAQWVHSLEQLHNEEASLSKVTNSVHTSATKH